MTLSIIQTGASSFRINCGAASAVIDDEHPTVELDRDEQAELNIEEFEPTVSRNIPARIAYGVYTIITAALSLLLHLDADWRELVSPFLLRATIPAEALPEGDAPLVLRYSAGGCSRKTGEPTRPRLTRESDGDAVAAELTANIGNIRSVFAHYTIRVSVCYIIGLCIPLVMLLTTNGNGGLMVLAIFLLVLMLGGFGCIGAYRRWQYRELTEKALTAARETQRG